MENTPLSSVLHSLRDQEAVLLQIVEGLRLQLQEQQSHLSRVRNAIKALEEPEPKEQGNRKPAPTKAAVQKLLVRELEVRPKESSEVLRASVQAKLQEAHYSLAGFALRFDEAWREVQKTSTPA